MTQEKLRLPKELDGQLWRRKVSRLIGRRMHRHAELEFNLVLSGAGAYLVDGRRYDLARGTLVWLFSEQDHLLIDETSDMSMWIAVFKPLMLQRWVAAGAPAAITAGRPAGAFCHMLAESAVVQLDMLIEQAAACVNDPPLFNAALSFVAMSAWRLHEHADESPPGAEVHPAVERAVRIIRTDPVNAEFEQVARRAGLSVSRLSRLFTQQTGVSLVTFRQRERLRRFTELYGRGRRRNMIEAALAAGFGSYAQFHRVFKQVYGVSPRQRQQNPMA